MGMTTLVSSQGLQASSTTTSSRVKSDSLQSCLLIPGLASSKVLAFSYGILSNLRTVNVLEG